MCETKGGDGFHAARVLEVHGDRQVHICRHNICAISRRRVAPTCCRSPDAPSGSDACPDSASTAVGTGSKASPVPGAGALLPAGSPESGAGCCSLHAGAHLCGSPWKQKIQEKYRNTAGGVRALALFCFISIIMLCVVLFTRQKGVH